MLWIAPTEKYTANAAYAARPWDANNQRLGISELKPEGYSGGCPQGLGLNRPKTDRFQAVPLSTD